jgi:large subunit ribosomal protein L22
MAITKKITPPIKKTTTPVVVSAPVFKDTRFSNKNILIGPRKLRFMATSIKTIQPSEALTRLKFTNTKSARILVKSILSAVNDAKSNHHLIESTLKFKSIRVDEGPKQKRMDKSHGSRFSRGVIIKRHSRLEIILTGQKQQ